MQKITRNGGSSGARAGFADGRIAADGPPAAVLTPQRPRAVYGVDALVGEHYGRLPAQPLDIAAGTETDRTMAEETMR